MGIYLIGPYKAVHIGSDEQLLYLSSYIHRNPVDLPDGRKNFYSYNWSSLIDYLEQSRWGELLKNEIILEQFESKSDYKNFIKTSPAKTDRLENLVLIDAVQ